MRFYDHYRGRSVGRLVGVMEAYTTQRHADYLTYGAGKVKDYDKLYATYTWDGDTDVPFFTFYNDLDGEQARRQEYFRPLLDDPEAMLGNVSYTIQEIGKLNPIHPDQVVCLMRQYSFHYNHEMIEKHKDHFVRCGQIPQHYRRYRIDEIAQKGYCTANDPGIPDHLILKPKPELPFKTA